MATKTKRKSGIKSIARKNQKGFANVELKGWKNIYQTTCEIFHCAEIAENEIKVYQQKYPAQKDIVWDSFKILRPTKGLTSLAEDVYVSHVRELLNRIMAGGHEKDVRLATNAELLYIFSQTMYSAPLNHDAAVVFTRLFSNIFGKQKALEMWNASNVSDPTLPQESYQGAADQILSELRNKFARDR